MNTNDAKALCGRRRHMSFTVWALIIVLAASLGEIILGIVRRSRSLVVIGVILAYIAGVAMYLAITYADALYIAGPGYIV